MVSQVAQAKPSILDSSNGASQSKWTELVDIIWQGKHKRTFNEAMHPFYQPEDYTTGLSACVPEKV